MLKKALAGILFTCIIILFYFAWYLDYVFIANLELVFLVILIAYHLLIDKKRSNTFLIVFGCFILNSVFLIGFNYTFKENNNYVIWGNLLGLLGYLIIMITLVNSKKFRLSISKYLLLIIFTLAVDCIIIYYYLKVMASLNIYISHTELSIFYPIIELILISIIIFYYLANSNLKSSLLVISMFSLFMSGIAQICQFLFFINNQLQALTILDVGFYIFGMFLLYKYFTSEENETTHLVQ